MARRDLEPAATVDLRLWGVSGAGAGTDPSRLRIHFRSCAHARVGSGRVPPSGAAQVCACLAGLYPWKQSARRLDALVRRPPQSLGHHVQLEGRIISAPLGDDLGAPAALRHQKPWRNFRRGSGFVARYHKMADALIKAAEIRWRRRYCANIRRARVPAGARDAAVRRAQRPGGGPGGVP